MNKDYKKIFLSILPVAAAISVACSFFSQAIALGAFVGSAVMIANMWILVATLERLFSSQKSTIVFSSMALLLKTIGLFGLSYIFISVLKINAMAFGLAAAATTLVASAALTLFNTKTEVCA